MKNNKQKIIVIPIVLIVISMFCISCSSITKEAIRYGSDQCNYCMMSIVDQNFGSELISTKGKVYKFDSIECMAAFENSNKVSQENIHSLWVTDISSPGKLQMINEIILYQSKVFRSPMGFGFYAVGNKTTANEYKEKYNSTTLTWNEIKIIVMKKWNKK